MRMTESIDVVAIYFALGENLMSNNPVNEPLHESIGSLLNGLKELFLKIKCIIPNIN